MAFLAGVRLRSASVRDGGWRHVPLPVSAAATVDPTDADVARAARARPALPAERLRLAVFIHALNELHRYGRGTPVGDEVRAWFASDAQWWPYHFLPICDGLGLDPDAVRARVLGHGPRAVEPTIAVLVPLVRRAAAR
ncbi:MAG TPA: hypothetical protein VLK79_16570 [Gaiellales bacterium]|nr:hypothetical protein [Gaiellales bacterium]